MTSSTKMRLVLKYHHARIKPLSKRLSSLLVTRSNHVQDQNRNGRSYLSVVAQGGSPLYLRNSSNANHSDIVVKEYTFSHPLTANSPKNLAINVLNSLSYTNTDKLNSHQLVQLIQSVVEAQYTYLYMNLPWLQDDIRIAKNQMHLMECDQIIMEQIVTHSSFMTLRQLVNQNLKRFTADELSQVLLCLLCLGLQPVDKLMTSLLLECHSKFDEISLKGLADLMDCYSLMPRTHLFMAKPVIRRVHECLNITMCDTRHFSVNHVSTIMGGLAALEPCDLWIKALDQTLNYLKDNDKSINTASVLSALKLVHKVPYKLRQLNSHICSQIIDRVCSVIELQKGSLKMSEAGQIARSLSKCNAYGSLMQDILVGRAQELLSSETRISNKLASLNTLTKYTPNEIKDEFVEAVMNTNQEIDIMHLSNLANICHSALIRNTDFIQKYQKEIAENVNKILKSDAETIKVIKFLIFNKFIDKANEMKFVDALLDSLQGNHGISNFRNTSLVSFLLCHAETSMSETLLNKMLASIPKWSPTALYTFMCGLNKMKEPMPWSLKKQVSFIQEFLYSYLGYKVKDMSDIPRLIKLYIGLGTHSKRRDPALIELILDEICKTASGSVLEFHDLGRILGSIAEKRTPYKPEICDILAPQIIQWEKLTPEKMLCVSLLARVCAIMGHQPKNFEGFISACKETLARLLKTDLRRALQLLLSLTTIEAYPEEALSKVFTMEFMEHVDNIVSGLAFSVV